MQLLKQIWNERRSNGWLWSELLIVFVVLWYVVDWTYVTARTYYEPVGFDITDTYYLELSLKNDKSNSYRSKEQKSTSLGQDIIELTNRLRRLPEVEAVSISNNARPYIGSNSGSMLRKPLYLPEGFRILNLGQSQVAKSIRGYVKSRGFVISELSKHGIGYATKGAYFGYLIIPFYYRGQLRYYNARNVIGQGPRYNNPNKDITGVGKEFIIFNYDALEMYRSVYICEGALNALTIGDRGIATMGKAISGYQVNELLKSSCERFIILLDPDAKKYAINLALKLVAYKKVKVVFLPEGKDVNDLGRKETLRLVYQTRYQSYQDLIQIRNSLE